MILRSSSIALTSRIVFSVAAVLGAISASPAIADIMLYPTRVVIEGGKRSAQVEIINRGEEPETYRIRIVNRRMTELGEIVPVEAVQPGEHFADGMIRYTPRQITLQPGASQTVRISLRKPADLAQGEYRSHLQFDRLADPSGSTDLDVEGAASTGRVSIMLKTLIGASIPVIVRHGETSAKVALESLRVEPGGGGSPAELSFTFRREGNRSVYGDLVAIHSAPGKKPVEIGAASGVAVYVPNAERKARLPLKLPEGFALTGGEIELQYRERVDVGGALIAKASIRLP